MANQSLQLATVPFLSQDGTINQPWLLYLLNQNTTLSSAVSLSGSLVSNDFVLGNTASSIKDSGFSIVPINKGGTGSSAQVWVGSVTGSGNIASSGGLTPNITFTGNLPVTNLASGVNATYQTFWRGDGAWSYAGVLSNVLLTKSAAYTVANADMGKTIACSGGFYTITFDLPNPGVNYAPNFSVTISNLSATRAKYISIHADTTSTDFFLWPQQSTTINLVGSTWVPMPGRTRWAHPSGLTLFYADKNNQIAAGSFSVGSTYIIATVGTTNWVSIGATSNAVGVQFIATGAGSGTGYASALTDGLSSGGAAFGGINQALACIYNNVDFETYGALDTGLVGLQFADSQTWTENDGSAMFHFREPWTGGGELLISGGSSGAAASTFSPSAGHAIWVEAPIPLISFFNMNLQSSAGSCVVCSAEAQITMQTGITYSTASDKHVFSTGSGSIVTLLGAYKVTGNAPTHMAATQLGWIVSTATASQIDMTANPAFSTGLCFSDRGGLIEFNASNAPFNGSPTGRAFYLGDVGYVTSPAGTGPAGITFPGSLATASIYGTKTFNALTVTSINGGTISGNNSGDQTNISGSSASCTGNAATATALQNARQIGGTSFNGTADITPDHSTFVKDGGGHTFQCNGGVASGTATATFSSTTKPGSNSTSAWAQITIDGNTYYIPIWT